MYFLGFSADSLSVPSFSNRSTGHNDKVRLGRISAVATRALYGGYRQQKAKRTEVLEESFLVPGDAFVDVGGGVRVPFGLARVAANDTVEVGAYFVRLTSADGVTLCASGLEERGALGSITCGEITTRSA